MIRKIRNAAFLKHIALHVMVILFMTEILTARPERLALFSTACMLMILPANVQGRPTTITPCATNSVGFIEIIKAITIFKPSTLF